MSSNNWHYHHCSPQVQHQWPSLWWQVTLNENQIKSKSIVVMPSNRNQSINLVKDKDSSLKAVTTYIFCRQSNSTLVACNERIYCMTNVNVWCKLYTACTRKEFFVNLPIKGTAKTWEHWNSSYSNTMNFVVMIYLPESYMKSPGWKQQESPLHQRRSKC